MHPTYMYLITLLSIHCLCLTSLFILALPYEAKGFPRRLFGMIATDEYFFWQDSTANGNMLYFVDIQTKQVYSAKALVIDEGAVSASRLAKTGDTLVV